MNTSPIPNMKATDKPMTPAPIVFGVAGGTASGKTTIAGNIPTAHNTRSPVISPSTKNNTVNTPSNTNHTTANVLRNAFRSSPERPNTYA